MTDEALPDLIVGYLGRGPASVSNVASHFGLTALAARDALLEMADAERILFASRDTCEVIGYHPGTEPTPLELAAASGHTREDAALILAELRQAGYRLARIVE